MYAHKNSLPVLQYLVSLITNSKPLKSRNTFIFKGGFCKCMLWSNILSRHYMTKRVCVQEFCNNVSAHFWNFKL